MIRRYSVFACVLLATVTTRIGADATAARSRDKAESQRDEAIKFLKTYVIDRSFQEPGSTFKLDNGKVEAVASGAVTYSNLVETKSGFEFDLTWHFKQINYDLDKNGKHISPGRDESSVDTNRYEIDERKSTGKLIGFNRMLASTRKNISPTGKASMVRIEMRGGALEVNESTMLYDDLFAEKGAFKPGAVDMFWRFNVNGGRVRLEHVETAFDVDPMSMKRTPNNGTVLKMSFTEEK
jgi:hypothetical protein